MTMQLALLPCQGIDERDLAALVARLAEKGFACTLLTEMPIPTEAFDRLRDQYRADRLLEAVRHAVAGRVLGVVDRDLYADGFNFVFGMAESPGRAALISVTRLRLGTDAARFQSRMLKEAVHELGHTFGLTHCRRPVCVMYFSNSLADTDRKGADFCPECQVKLALLRVHL